MFQSFMGLFREQPGVYQSWTRIGLVVGIGCTFGYAFFALQSTAIEMWTHNMVVLSVAIALFKAPRRARTEPVFWLLGAMFLLSLFSYAQTHLFLPHYAEEYVVFNKLSAVFGFFVIAWWIGGDTRRLFTVLLLALAGFICAILINGHLSQIMYGIEGRRVDFGFQNAQHTAMFFTTALMGWGVFSLRFLRARTVGRYLVWATVLFLLGAGVVVTQTRAAWLGLLAAALVVAGFGLLRARRANAIRVSTLLLIAAIALVVVVALVGRFAKTLEKRVNAESDVIALVARGAVDSLPDRDIGIRIKLWREAIIWIGERPVTGWGYMIRDRFIADSPNLPEGLKRFGHAHNSYIEILLIYGLVGLAVFGTLMAYVTSQVWKAWRKGEIPDDVALFGFAFFTFWLVVNVFESYIFGKTGTYLVAIVVGSVYTFPLASRLRRTGPEAQVPASSGG